MNYIKIKNSQTKGSVTKDIDFLIPVDAIATVKSTSATVAQINLNSIALDTATELSVNYQISGFGTDSNAFQAIYALIDKIAKSPNTISDYLEINGDSDLTVAFNYG